jgi:DNA polymerase-3 subunit epsilon
MLAFDVESTGVDARNDRIVSWCAAWLLPDGHVNALSELVNPGVPIPPGATEVHKITDEMVQRAGNPPHESLWRLLQVLAEAVIARIPIVGMNVAYDFTMAYWESRRWALPWVEDTTRRPLAPVVDCYVLDNVLVPRRYGKGARKLEKLVQYYEVRHDGAHDAVADALAAARVVYRQASRNPRIGNMPLHELHAKQKMWRGQQQVSLQAYFDSVGKEAICDPCWPVCTTH